jgi:hypothetical protein
MDTKAHELRNVFTAERIWFFSPKNLTALEQKVLCTSTSQMARSYGEKYGKLIEVALGVQTQPPSTT